jgi:hypothetical protein
MDTFLDAVVAAALPAAVGLLVATAAARAVLWAPGAGERARRIAQRYAEQLSLWCLVALVAFALGSAADGTSGFGSIALTLLVAACAVLLRPGAPRAEPRPVAEPTPTPAAAPAPAAGDSLWADAAADEPARRQGLWSR